MQMVAPDVFVHVPPLLCGVSALRADREKMRILETGQNTAFGAFPVYVGATMISGFVATALIWGPWATSAHKGLQEAGKSGISDLGIGLSHFRARRFKLRPACVALTACNCGRTTCRASAYILGLSGTRSVN